MNNEFFKGPYVAPAGILGLGLIVSAFIGAITFYQVRTFDNNLSVTGSAKERVSADSVKWTFTLTRTVSEGSIQNGYASLARDLALAQAFLKSKNVTEEETAIAPVFVDEIYKYDQNLPREYNVRQTITIQSKELEKITGIAKSMQELSNKGVFFTMFPPEYYYSGLAELRVRLLGDAIKDAKARAESIAKSSGQKVGPLKAAASGVVQVLAPNSIEVADFGQYDTSTVEKDVMVTVRATFVVR